MSMSVKEAATRLIDAYKKYDPEMMKYFKGPASASDIQTLERWWKDRLPPSVKELYSVMSAGQIGGWELCPPSEVVDEWDGWDSMGDDFNDEEPENTKNIQPVWWHPRWLPILKSGGGANICIDYKPGSGGSKYQVVEMDHEDGPVFRESDFREWFFKEVQDAIQSLEKHAKKTADKTHAANSKQTNKPWWKPW